MLVFGFGWPLVARVARLARAQNITSIADFLAARYGKSEAVAAVAAIIAVIGVVPYIALQLKAISATLAIGFGNSAPFEPLPPSVGPDRLALASPSCSPLFAMAFGTRRVDAGEHQNGLMVTIAAESVVKLLAFLVVGGFVVWGVRRARRSVPARRVEPAHPRRARRAARSFGLDTLTLLSSGAMMFLPRQFHVAIVENHDEGDIRSAAVSLSALSAGDQFLCRAAGHRRADPVPRRRGPRRQRDGAADLRGKRPHHAGRNVGGLSAATAMVVVESVALSIMVSNNLVLPMFLRFGRWRNGRARTVAEGEAGRRILRVRRAAILVVLLLAFGYYRLTGEALLASIGILSFACVAQFGAGLHRRAGLAPGTALGAIAGLITGVTIWAFMLLAPSLDAGVMQRDHRRGAVPAAPRPALAGHLQPADVHARPGRVLEPAGQQPRLCQLFAGAPPHPDRAPAGRYFRQQGRRADGPGVSALAHQRLGGGSRGHGRTLSRRPAHARGLRDLLHRPRPEL